MITLLAPYLPLIAYVLVLLFITLYAVLSAIEFGFALFLALPNPPVERSTIERYFGPAWESTNVFLVFSLVGLVMFFPHVETYLALLYLPAGVALFFYFLRVLGIFGIFYADSPAYAWKLVFALGSIGAPLSLTGAAYLALTGNTPPLWPSTLSWSLWGATLGAILMLAAAFIARFALPIARTYLQRAQLVGTLLFVFAGGALLSFNPGATSPGLAPIIAFFLMLAAAIGGLSLSERAHFFAAYVSYALSVAVLIYGIALSHLPYLIYPVLTIQAAFTAPEMFLAMLSVVPFGLIVAIPTVVLLWHLYARAEQ